MQGVQKNVANVEAGDQFGTNTDIGFATDTWTTIRGKIVVLSEIRLFGDRGNRAKRK